MAKKTPATQSTRAPAQLVIPRGEAAEKLDEGIKAGEALLKRPIRSPEEFDVVEQDYISWGEYNAELLTRIFDTPQYREQYEAWGPTSVPINPSLREKVGRLHEDIRDHCRRLDSLLNRLPLIDEMAPLPSTSPVARTVFDPNDALKANKSMSEIRVFVSHSAKDAAFAKAWVDCVEACIEVPDKGMRCTSVPGYKLAPGDVSDDVLRDNLEQCSVVIGLLTEESVGSGYVTMELGAAWGLQKTTCALLAPGVEYKRVPGPLARRHAVMADSDHDIVSVMDVISEKTGWPLRGRAKSTAAVSTFVTVTRTLEAKGARGS